MLERSADLANALVTNLGSEREKLQTIRDKLQSSLDNFEDLDILIEGLRYSFSDNDE